MSPSIGPDAIRVGRAARSGFTRLAHVASAIAILLGCSVLLGWVLDIGALKSPIPGSVTMRVNTAVSFVLAGLSLELQIEPSSASWRARVARLCALVTLAVGSLTLLEYAYDADFGIQQLLLRVPAGELEPVSPGRMASNTALCFVLLGLVLACLDASSRWAVHATLEALTLAVFAIGYVAVCGYALSTTALYGVAGYGSMAAHTAAGLAVLSTGVLVARPQRGITALLAQDDPGGSALRRVLPVLMVIPLMVAGLLLKGRQAGYYGSEFELSLMVAVTTGVLVSLAVWNARVQHAAERTRRQLLRDERFLYTLGEILRISRSGDAIAQVSKSLGEYLAASRCLFAVVDVASDQVTIRGDYHAGLPSLTGTRPLSTYSPEAIRDSKAGRTIVSGDASTDPRMAPQYETAYRPMGARAFVSVPLVRNGQWVWTLLVTVHEPRAWQAREVALVESVAERSWLWIEHITALEQLRTSEQNLSVMMNSIGEGIIATDAAGLTVRMNPIAERLTGWSQSEAATSPLHQIFRALDEETRAPVEPPVDRLLRDGKSIGPFSYMLLVSRDGSVCPIAGSSTAIRGKDGAIQGAVLVFRDASQERKAQRDIERSAEQFRLAIEAAPAGMLMIDRNGTIVMVNVEIEKQFGYGRAELIGQPVEMLVPARVRDRHPGYRDRYHQDPRSRLMGAGRDLHGVRKDGSEIPVEIGLNPLRSPAGEFVLCSVADITERRKAEREREGLLSQLQTLNVELEARVRTRTLALTGALEEREVLLQEIHHRVKNNLQVISSLLNLQLHKTSDVPARSALADCKTRVEAIALIHDQLYQSKNYARIPFSEYAANLAANILHATGASLDRIALQLDVEAIALPVDKAIPCGLILNELLTNVLKHAFPDGRHGTICVELRNLGKTVLLVVRDDGVGMPTNFDVAKSRSLGLRLVTTLVEQLDGQLDLIANHGSEFRIEFPVGAVS